MDKQVRTPRQGKEKLAESPDFIPLCTSNAYNRTQISSLANTLEQFRIRNNISQATLSADD